MTDIWTKEKRSEVMSKIKGTDTRPEILTRKSLHALGYRFTVNGPRNKLLAGRPDIVLPRYKTVVFVNGCFWHCHKGCKIAHIPKSRTLYWREKLKKNVLRDRKNINQLHQDGWKVIIVWECETHENQKLLNILRERIGK